MESFDIQDYIRPLLRWWWLLAVSTLLAAGLSAYTVMGQPAVYSSHATVMVGDVLAAPNPSSGELYLASQLAGAYADLARRATISGAAAQALNLPGLPAYWVQQVPNTQLIEIAVNDTDPVRAQAVAQELVNQLILRTPGGTEEKERQAFVDQELDSMEQSIADTKAGIDRLNQELEGLFSARQIADTNAQISALELKLTTIQANYAALLQNSGRSATNTLTVLEPANLPTQPQDSNALMMVVAAGMLGFALAAAGAYLLDYIDDTFRAEQEVQRRLDLPMLGAIPDMGRRAQRDGALDIEAVRQSPAGHAFGGLRIVLEAVSVEQPVKVLLVSSPGIGEGKSFVAANLCVEMARSGQRVILVDADLRRPSQQRLFRLPNLAGLTTLIQNEQVPVQELLQPTNTPGLSVLTSGPLPSDPAHFLSSARMQTVLELLRARADKVVIDAPPMTAAVDASILATLADGVLMVVAIGRTRRHPTLRTVKLLRQLHANLLGVVLDSAPLKASHYSNTHYSRIQRRRSPGVPGKKPSFLSSNGANGSSGATGSTGSNGADAGQLGVSSAGAHGKTGKPEDPK